MGCQFSAIRRTRAPRLEPHLTIASASPPLPCILSTSVDRRSEGSQIATDHRQTLIKQPNHSQRQLIRIDILPDDVLLEIFDFYQYPRYEGDASTETEAWQTLVHVCRQWRCLVLASPRRLNLQLFCKPYTLTRDRLDVWPALPLIIQGSVASSSSTNNVIAAFGQSNRVCQVALFDLAGWHLEQVLAAMQVPFPELTDLQLISSDETPQIIPDSFLDGSAPRLRYLNIPFPGLPSLLLSALHLVQLKLINIPHSGYISPKAIVALLSVLSSLEAFSLDFRSPQSRPDRESRHPPPPKRSVIPALVSLVFGGVTEYLEDLVTLIDTPQLNIMYITFFNQIDFDTPRLTQFIDRTLKLAKPEAHVQFNDSHSHVVLQHESSTLDIGISCKEPDWQLSIIEQVCNSSLHPISTIEDLYIEHQYHRLVWKDESIENTLWLQFLQPFTAVKNLYISKAFSRGIAATLQELVEGRITEVLPSLQNIFVSGLDPRGDLERRRFQETMGRFVAARQLSDHPITIRHWNIYL